MATSGLKTFTAGPFINHGDSGDYTKEINILNWNVEGLGGALALITKDILENYEICILTETFLTEEIGYNVAHMYNVHAHV